jgi:membrane protein implicated in regulation of membrane protease activity
VLFALISVVALWYLRRHFNRWLRGSEVDLAARDQDDAGLLGVRVAVLTDFIDGIGHVQLNGAKWDAESNESLKAGDTAWVLNHSGIVLQVSAQRPEKS